MSDYFLKINLPKGLYWLIPITLLSFYLHAQLGIHQYEKEIKQTKDGLNNKKYFVFGPSEFEINRSASAIMLYKTNINVMSHAKFYSSILIAISLCLITGCQIYKKRIQLFTFRDFLFFLYVNINLMYIFYLILLTDMALIMLLAAPIPLITILLLNKFSGEKTYNNFATAFLCFEGFKIIMILSFLFLASISNLQF